MAPCGGGRVERVVAGGRPDVEGWAACDGLTFREAEQLLDWLEANGWTRREVKLTDEGVRVRWAK
jgi:hypothetical protein